MNIRYDNLKVKEGTLVPSQGLAYPQDDPYVRLISPEHDRHIDFDENYPYLDDSFDFKFNNFFGYYFFLYPVLFTVNTLKNGLRVRGRENLRKYRKQLKGGAITICNHCYVWDCPCVLQAIHARHTTRIPMLSDNFMTKDHWFLRSVGGIPIPDSITALKRFNAAFDEFHKRGYWMHVYPEAKRWDFYKPIRPFRKGAFTMAYKYNMPIIPCVITYRERKGIYRLFAPADQPLLSIEIGEPIFPNSAEPRKNEVNRLREEAHLCMQRMAGITHNTWPIVPEDE